MDFDHTKSPIEKKQDRQTLFVMVIFYIVLSFTIYKILFKGWTPDCWLYRFLLWPIMVGIQFALSFSLYDRFALPKLYVRFAYLSFFLILSTWLFGFLLPIKGPLDVILRDAENED